MKINIPDTRRNRFARSLLIVVAAVAVTSSLPLSAQDDKKEPPRRQERKGPPPVEHRAAPQTQQNTQQQNRQDERRTPPPVQQQAPPQVPINRPPQQAAPPQQQQQQQQQQRPVYRAPENQPQPVRPTMVTPPPANNNPNQGRQFGNGAPNRGGEPGRQFGNGAPPRDSRPTINGARPAYHGPNNTQVTYRPNGQPREVHTRDMTIVHAPTGVRRVVVERPDRTVIVTNNAGHGYVQRPFVVRNTTFVQRTYYVSGRPYTHIYRPYVFGGISLHIYAPARYYAPAYYGWVYNPWATPVFYNWGWRSRPWYGYYGGYFTPYPSYASAAFWLTDFLIAASLEEAYQERMDAQAAAYQPPPPVYSGDVTLTPEVKQAIADEVRAQIDQERREGQMAASGDYNGAPSFLSDNSTHVFVVSSSLELASRDGECSVTQGDVLQMRYGIQPGADTADVFVLAAKPGGCRRDSVVSVNIADLVDMQNQMRATLDRGLSDLQSRQGQDGLPAPPPAAMAPPVQAPYASAAPPPDQNVASELTRQAQVANEADAAVLNQAQSGIDAGAPPTVTAGMSIDEVVAIMGRPLRIGDLGSRKTYFYDGMKIIFTDGRVTDIQ